MSKLGAHKIGLLVAALHAGASAAGGVVIVTDGRIAQYREAVAAAHDTAKSATELDVSASNAADQLRQIDPSVILAVGQKSIQLARDTLPSVPVVYCMAFERTVASSPSVTGVPLEIPSRDQLTRIKQIDPAAHRVGVFYDSRTDAAFVSEAQRAATSLGLTLVARPVSDAKEVRTVTAEMAPGIDALWLLPDPKLVNKDVFNYLLVFTLERKIALFGFLDSFTQAGALASIAPDYADIGRRAGGLAAEISQRPPDKRTPVPATVHATGSVTINLKAAEQLGIDVPAAALSGAKQVFR